MANGKSILDLLSLAAECGSMLALEAEGCDAEVAVAALANLISAESHDLLDESLLQDSLPISKLGSEPTSHRLGGQQSHQGVARVDR